MIVPTRSPATTRRMFPDNCSKTWIGISLSMQSDNAVVSITFKPRSIATQRTVAAEPPRLVSPLGAY